MFSRMQCICYKMRFINLLGGTRNRGKTTGIYFTGNLKDGLCKKTIEKQEDSSEGSLGAFLGIGNLKKNMSFSGLEHKHKYNFDKTIFFLIFIFKL